MSTTHSRIGAIASVALIVFVCVAQATSFQLTSVSSSATLVHHQPPPATGALRASTGADETTANIEGEDCACPEDDGPGILQPYLPAMDPEYSSKGAIGEGDFVISRSGGPTAEELSNEQMLKIVKIECTDLEVNTLVWKCLGYRFDEGSGDAGEWQPDEVFPKWRERFPTPPDFIGMQRVYSREVDEPCLRANQALVRSIPAENKQNIKAALTPLGWKGYKYKGLTPNKTRRAQCANWLVFFREELFGYSLEELRERRRLKREAEAAAAAEEEGWKPPVKEVY